MGNRKKRREGNIMGGGRDETGQGGMSEPAGCDEEEQAVASDGNENLSEDKQRGELWDGRVAAERWGLVSLGGSVAALFTRSL